MKEIVRDKMGFFLVHSRALFTSVSITFALARYLSVGVVVHFIHSL